MTERLRQRSKQSQRIGFVVKEPRATASRHSTIPFRRLIYYKLLRSDLDNDKILDFTGSSTTNEVINSNTYYPFGMVFGNNSPANNTTTPDTKYQYNGKEFNSDLGLNLLDYGARWYDPAIGRFTTVDPLASKYSGWSPYNYVMNNPIRLVDPTGMAPDDIIIRAKKEETRDNQLYVPTTFKQLQSLTSNKLDIDANGKVTIVGTEGGNEKAHPESTKLISDIIGDKTETTTITNDVGLSGIREPSLLTNSNTLPIDDKKSENGTGTGSTIFHLPNVKAKMTMANGDRADAKPSRVLQHEPIHADNNRTGTRASLVPINGGQNQEERNTNKRENTMNGEQRKEE